MKNKLLKLVSPIGDNPTQNIYDSIALQVDNWKWSKFWMEYEFPLVEEWVKNQSGSDLLNAGCGTGEYLIKLSSDYNNLIGLDLSQGMLDVAHDKINNNLNIDKNKFIFIQGDLTSINLARGSINSIVSNRVFSLIEQVDLVFEQMYQVLAVGGEICITDIHPLHPYIQTHVKVEDKDVNLPTYKHSLKNLETFASKAGFQNISIQEVTLSQLKPPPSPTEFEKLYLGVNPPIFYILTARK